MKTKLRFAALLSALAFVSFSCKENFQILDEKNENSSTLHSGERTFVRDVYSDSELLLGKKLENPYGVENMEKAVKSLEKKGVTLTSISVKANYYYVRFLPATNEEYDKLNADKTVDLFEYPLDYQIIKQGNVYRDQSLPASAKFTWLYAAIPIESVRKFNLKYEILEELYLPFGNGKEPSAEMQIKEKDYLTRLEEESLALTGNIEETDNKKIRATDWYSSGRIRVWDDRLHYNEVSGQYEAGSGWVPVPQCLVRGNRWFTTKSALSYNNGYFFIDHGWPSGKEVNYSIKWDRADFDIRSGSYGQAYFNGPKIQGQWNLDISEGGTPDNYIYAHVHRAAWYYYYNNTFGVLSPPTSSGFLGGKLHLGAKQGNGRSHYFGFNSAWAASEVKLVFDLSTDDARTIFGTTIHELTHVVHWAIGMTYEAYCANVGQAGRLAESWAQAVGWHVTREVYGHAANPLGDFDHTQLTSLTTMGATGTCVSNGPWYTPLFIDLMDDYNQVVQGGNRPDDQASGYTIVQLQSFLLARPTNWYSYRTYLENNSSNPTEAAASQLFSDYD
jgi:hypothetical protein